MEDADDRLINAKELIRLTTERCGIEGIKFIELIRDCPDATALPLKKGE